MARRARVCYLVNTCIVVRYTPGHSGIHPRASILTMIVAVLYNRDAMRNDNIGRANLHPGQKCVRSARPWLPICEVCHAREEKRREEERRDPTFRYSSVVFFAPAYTSMPISRKLFPSTRNIHAPSIVIFRSKKNFMRVSRGEKISASVSPSALFRAIDGRSFSSHSCGARNSKETNERISRILYLGRCCCTELKRYTRRKSP